MDEPRKLSPNEAADAARMKQEADARASLDAEHQALSDSELEAALQDATAMLSDEDGVRRHASLACEIERRATAATERAKREPAPQMQSASPVAPPARPTRQQLQREHDERMEECLRAVAAEQPTGVRARKQLTADEIHDIARNRNPRATVVMHPTSVEPHPDLPPPLCVEIERRRLEKENRK